MDERETTLGFVYSKRRGRHPLGVESFGSGSWVLVLFFTLF